jgi:hypothetical protein
VAFLVQEGLLGGCGGVSVCPYNIATGVRWRCLPPTRDGVAGDRTNPKNPPINGCAASMVADWRAP